jgi:hypothetical protein
MQRRSVKQLRSVKFLNVACLVLLSLGCAFAQQPPPIKGSSSSTPNVLPPRDGGDDDQISPREEMLKDVEIKRREATYQENLDRARETAQLGSEVRDAFKRQMSLSNAELKKLARIEKLARSIRNDAGGGDDETTLKDPPARLDAALDRLAEICTDFRKKVEKTPRHVVSAAVITSANQLIELTRLIKNLGG